MKQSKLILLFWIVAVIAIAEALTQDYNSQSRFDNGTYYPAGNISYNETALVLNTTSKATSGSWTSNVTIATTLSNISFSYAPLKGELSSSTNRREVDNFESGLVALYHLNNESAYGENNTLVVDFSGNGNNGSCVTCPKIISSGKLNGAYNNTDANNGYFNITPSASLNNLNTVTISVWIKSSSQPTSSRHIFGGFNDSSPYNGFGITQTFDTHKAGFWVGGASYLYSNTLINTNNWINIIASYNGTHSLIYINGVFENSSAQTANLNFSKPKCIGDNSAGATNRDFVGSIDEVAIWNRSLSATEISTLYDSQLALHKINVGYAVNGSSDYTSLPNITESNYVIDQSITNFSIRVNLTTSVGNWSPILYNLTIGYETGSGADTNNPTINFTSPTTSSGTHESQTWIYANITFTDETGIQNATIFLYNSSRDLINSTNSSTSPLSINFTGLSYDTYYLNATAWDTSEHSNSTETRTIILTADGTPPAITLNYPTDASAINSSSLFNCTANDAVGISNVTLWGNWSGWQANITDNSGLNNYDYNFTMELGQGSYLWNCQGCDPNGNCGFAAANFSFSLIYPSFNLNIFDYGLEWIKLLWT